MVEQLVAFLGMSIKNSMFMMISINLRDIEMNIVPIYLNEESWDRDFENLKMVLCEIEAKNLILIGDFNARICNLQILREEIFDAF